ncbi:uncharacterized protein G2W53_017413 [Senna tora]|uniref:Uncharacterized protein n=1 Tax=Senna tora TaxID=362788 RepID=A0A834WQU5_9FABA|nr:uncharacterized protein G2W53_017413 [Senna tora]
MDKVTNTIVSSKGKSKKRDKHKGIRKRDELHKKRSDQDIHYIEPAGTTPRKEITAESKKSSENDQLQPRAKQ